MMKNLLKTAFAMSLMLGIAPLAANAANFLDIAPFEIKAGESQTVEVVMNNGEAVVAGVQFDIYLPEGFEIAKISDVKQVKDRFYYDEDNEAYSHSFSKAYQQGSKSIVRVMISPDASYGSTVAMNCEEGNTIAKIIITAAATIPSGEQKIAIKEISYSDTKAKTTYPSDVEISFNKPSEPEPEPDPEAQGLFIPEFSLNAGEKTTVFVKLNNIEPYAGVQFDVCLPEGMTIASLDDVESVKDRFAYDEENRVYSHEFGKNYIGGDSSVVRLLIYPNTSYKAAIEYLKDDTGAIAKITLTSTKDLVGGNNAIKFTNVSFAKDVTETDYPGDFISYFTATNKVAAPEGEMTQTQLEEFQQSIAENTSATEIDLTNVTSIPAGTTIETANPNAFVTVSPEIADNIANESNVIVVDSTGEATCEKLVISTEGAFSVPIEFVAKEAVFDPNAAQSAAGESNGTPKYATICLPYAPDKTNHIFYTLNKAYSEGLSFTEVAETEANKPYLYTLKDGAAENIIVSKEVTVKTGGAQNVFTEDQSWKMVGTFSEVETAADYYFLNNDKIWKNGGNLTVAPFKAYFVSYDAAAIESVSIIIDGAFTGIETVENEIVEENAPRYNVFGVRVNDNYKGIVIVNGKKYINK